MPAPVLLEEVRIYLIEEGICQEREQPPSETIPSVWLNPRRVALEPRANEVGTITLVPAPEGPRPSGTAPDLDDTIVDVIVRARRCREAELFQRNVRVKLEAVKQALLGDLRVEWIALWRGDSARGSEANAYAREQSFRICHRAATTAELALRPDPAS